MLNDTTYYIEIAISFIIIFILLYIAIQIRKSSMTFDSYYQMKKKSLEDIDSIRLQHTEDLEKAKYSRGVGSNEYSESYNLKTEKIANTLDELKEFNDEKNNKKPTNGGGDANDN